MNMTPSWNQRRRLLCERLSAREMLAHVTIFDTSVAENDGTIEFTLRLDQASSQPVTAEFSTVDGTARAGVDFEAVTDQPITFQVGETEKSITVNIDDNLLRDGDRSFTGRVTTQEDSGSEIHELSPGHPVRSHSVSPDGNWVIFNNGFDESIHTVPIDGSLEARQVAPANPIYGGGHLSRNWKVTPDSQRLVFVADFEEERNHHLYSVPIDGSEAPVRLSGPLNGGIMRDSTSFFITPDSKSVVYRFQASGSDQYDAYVAPIDGASSAVSLGADQLSGNFGLSDDGAYFLYQTSDFRVYSVPLDRSRAPVELTAGVREPRFFGFSAFEGMAESVFVVATYGTNDYALYRMPIDGSSPAVLVAPHNASRIRLSEDGQRVVYYVDLGIVQPKEIFSAPIDGSSEPTPLVPSLSDGDNVWDYALSETSDVVSFRAAIGDSTGEVFAVPVDGSTAPVRLSDRNEVGSVRWVGSSPAGDLALFVASTRDGDHFTPKLYSVTTDGQNDPVDLSPQVEGDLAVNITYEKPTFGPDGRTVTYLVSRDGDLVGLYAVPIDGSSPPRLMNAPLQPEGVLSKGFPFTVSQRGVVSLVHEDDPLSAPPQSMKVHSRLWAEPSVVEAIATIVDDDLMIADFGDAPASNHSGFPSSYPVTLEQNGARHTVGDLFLGQGVDVESDGQFSGLGDQDDVDEDALHAGITPTTTFLSAASNTVASVNVVSSSTGRLDAWFDFNRDGDWEDLGEQIATAFPVQAGENTLTFSIPADAGSGATAARFRLSSAGRLEPTGAAIDGEVEDYWFTLVGTDSAAGHVELNLSEGDSVFEIDGDLVSLIASGVKRFEAPLDAIAEWTLSGTADSSTVTLPHQLSSVPLQVTADRLRLSAEPSNESTVFDFTSGGHIDAIGIREITLDSDGSIQAVFDATSAASSESVLVIGDEDDQLVFQDHEQWRMESARVDGSLFIRKLRHVASGASVEVSLPHAWRNVLNPYDVNNNGAVSAGDALRIINELGRRTGSGDPNELGDPADSMPWAAAYVDSNGDDRISPRDALLVINYLASQFNGAEAEAIRQSEVRLHSWQTRIAAHRSAEDREIEGSDILVLGGSSAAGVMKIKQQPTIRSVYEDSVEIERVPAAKSRKTESLIEPRLGQGSGLADSL